MWPCVFTFQVSVTTLQWVNSPYLVVDVAAPTACGQHIAGDCRALCSLDCPDLCVRGITRATVLQLPCFTSAKCLHRSSFLQCYRILSLFTTESCPLACLDHVLPIHLGCCRLSAVVNSAAMNLCSADAWRYFGVFTQKAIASYANKRGYYSSVFGLFGRGFIGVSIEIAMFYNPANSTWRILLPHL